MSNPPNPSPLKTLKGSLFLSALILFGLAACTSKQEKTTAPISQSFEAERAAFFSSLRTPEDVSANLLPGLSGFNPALLHRAKDFHRYASNDVKAAANLGIYLADLNYCVLFKESAVGKEYLTAVLELSNVILMEKGTLEFLMTRYENNLAQNDSLRVVVQELLSNATHGLQGSIKERLAGIAMAAYQLENLHLALATLETFPATLNEEQQKSKDLLVQFVSGQQTRMEIIYNFIKANTDPMDPENNPNYPFYDNALREVLYVYQQSANGELKIKEFQAAVEVLRSKVLSVE